MLPNILQCTGQLPKGPPQNYMVSNVNSATAETTVLDEFRNLGFLKLDFSLILLLHLSRPFFPNLA